MTISKNIIKWVMGLSSVLVFTGCVGLTEQDQGNAGLGGSTNQQSNQLDNSNSDSMKSNPQLNDSGTAMGGSNQTMNQVGNPAPNRTNQRMRTRAS